MHAIIHIYAGSKPLGPLLLGGYSEGNPALFDIIHCSLNFQGRQEKLTIRSCHQSSIPKSSLLRWHAYMAWYIRWGSFVNTCLRTSHQINITINCTTQQLDRLDTQQLDRLDTQRMGFEMESEISYII